MLAQSRFRDKNGRVVRHRPTFPFLDHHPKALPELAAVSVPAITAVVHTTATMRPLLGLV